ncbi:MAG: hypothetical protein CL840_15825 [Crocinitomicaceae bacterium]|jgi:hypothetical protein|nr:hypothetical protein [Crocinitomicaceae bacterium]|tara:strand:- start:31364 stop:31714 length:351 start_codon:yes stop_codon:yes gene_type:complete
MQFQYVCTQADVMITQVKRTMMISSVVIGSVMALPFKHLTLPLIMIVLGLVMYSIGKELIDWQKERDALNDDEKQRVKWTLRRKHVARYALIASVFSAVIAIIMFHATNWLVWNIS